MRWVRGVLPLPVSLLICAASLVLLPVFIEDGLGQTAQQKVILLGYTTKSLPDVDVRDATAAFNMWLKELGESEGSRVEAYLYPDAASLMKDYRKGKFTIVFLRTIDYFAYAFGADIQLGWTKVKQGKPTVRYVLLVRNGASYSDLKGLRQKRLAVHKQADLGLLFLNTQLLKAKLPEAEQFFGSIQEKSKESQAILAVFFGRADACVVTEESFRTMTELNPQVGKMLQVAAMSPDLVEIVSFFPKETDETMKYKMVERSRKLASYPRGRQILLLFNAEGTVALTEAHLQGTKQLIDEYGRLKKKKP